MPRQATAMQTCRWGQLDHVRDSRYRRRGLPPGQLRVLVHVPRRPKELGSKLNEFRRLDRRAHDPHPRLH